MRTPRSLLALAVAFTVATVPSLAVAAPAGKWTGRATSKDGKFRYGKVTFTVRGSTIRNFKIAGVTTSGCGGFKDVVVPKITIRGSRFLAVYEPVPGADDTIRINGTFTGSTAKGTFQEGPLCSNGGKFTAKRG